MSHTETVNAVSEPDTTRPGLGCIYFYIGGCNLRCRHCWVDAGYQKDVGGYPYALDFNLFKSIVDQAKPLGLSTVKLTGGEPLLHPSIHQMLRLVKDYDYKLVVETNGTLVTPKIAKMIAECKTPFASVSIDGSDAETHEWLRNVPGCFEQSITGIRRLVDAGLRPQLIMMVMLRNKHQMEAVVRLAESLGCGSVKFNLMNPTSRGKVMQNNGETLFSRQYIEVGRWVERELVPSSSIGVCYNYPCAFVPLSNMYRASPDGLGGTCGITGVIGVLGDGNYALCGIGETVKDLTFGNAAEFLWPMSGLTTQCSSKSGASFPTRLRECAQSARC